MVEPACNVKIINKQDFENYKLLKTTIAIKL